MNLKGVLLFGGIFFYLDIFFELDLGRFGSVCFVFVKIIFDGVVVIVLNYIIYFDMKDLNYL